MQKCLKGSLVIMSSVLLFKNVKVDNFLLIYSSIWKVSKNWREIIIQDKSADKRRKLYIKHLKEAAGVRFVSKVIFFFKCERRQVRGKRKYLVKLQKGS